MWENGFHNSVNGDRTYNANQLSGIFEGLITDGVYETIGEKLAVTAFEGMKVKVKTGRGWFNQRWVCNTTPYIINLEPADVTLNRYAAICIKSDNSQNARTTQPVVKYSEFASKPTKPSMVRSNEVKEYCLAYVYIKAGAKEITQADVEDTRQNSELCGWVTGLIKQITPDTLYTQFTSIFEKWFSNLQNRVQSTPLTKVISALPNSYSICLESSKWEKKEDKYFQKIMDTNITDTKTIIIKPGEKNKKNFYQAGIKTNKQNNCSLEFIANSLPEGNVEIEMVVM